MKDVLTMHELKSHQAEHCPPLRLAEAYIRNQPWERPYPPEEGLQMGTAFPGLSKPYAGWQKREPC
jgi:hypothetical protein